MPKRAALRKRERQERADAPAPGALRPGRRQFFCRACGVSVLATDPPDGWLRIQLRDSEQERRNSKAFQTVAMVCGLRCLKAWATTTKVVKA